MFTARKFFEKICDYSHFLKLENGDYIDLNTNLIYHYDNNDIYIKGIVDVKIYERLVKEYSTYIIANKDKYIIPNDKKYIELLIKKEKFNSSLLILDIIHSVNVIYSDSLSNNPQQSFVKRKEY